MGTRACGRKVGDVLDSLGKGSKISNMKRTKRTVIAGALVVGVAAAGVILVSVAAAGPDWACPKERIAVETFELASGGGYKTTEEAIKDQARVLAADGVASEEALLAAAAASGDSGRLVVEGELVAEIGFARLSDGTWTIASATFCSPPPESGGSPFPTPAGEGS